MTQYNVHARRWENGWELHILGIGVTQCETPDQAEREVHDYMTSLLPEGSDIRVIVDYED